MDWAPPSETVCETIGANTATSLGTTLAVGASNNAKGAWTQLVASTARNTSLIELAFGYDSGSTSDTVGVDIGVGAAGSEQALVSNLWADITSTQRFQIPMEIPAGKRIAARYQTNGITSSVLSVTAHLFSLAMQRKLGCSRSTTLGFTSATTAGQSITPGSGVKGSWSQFSSSLPFNIKYLQLMLGRGSNGEDMLLDIGVGAAAAEVVAVPDIAFGTFSGNAAQLSCGYLIPVDIPAATRLAARLQAVAGGSNLALVMTAYG